MTALRRALLIVGWAVLLLGPLAGALVFVRPEDATAVAYGSTPPSRALAALEAAVPAGIAAGVLFSVIGGRVRRAGARLSPVDELLVTWSQMAGWLLTAIGAVLLLAVMVFGGPPGIIGGFATFILVFSLAGRGRRRRATSEIGSVGGSERPEL